MPRAPTPGPWQVSPDGLSVLDDCGRRLATAPVGTMPPADLREEAEANIRVMAASAEMVGHLRDALHFVLEHVPAGEPGRGSQVSRLRRVIARAGGRS